MRKKSYRYFAADFETTVYEGQEETEVWSAAIVELWSDTVSVFTSIDELWEYLKHLKCNCVVDFHNLKFDGSFWIDYFLRKLKFDQAYRKDKDGNYSWLPEKWMYNNTFKYSISSKGMWYSLTVKVNNHIITFQDSLKLLPFSLTVIGKSFKTKHQKLELEYEGFRKAGQPISEHELPYIKNDVLLLKEALEIMFSEGHDKLTIGSCCFAEYKNICKTSLKNPMEFDEMFPDVYKIKNPHLCGDEESAGDFIVKSYKGGWTYVVKEKANKIFHNGLTADVNSLYPSVMHSESDNIYPIGYPTFWTGEIPEQALRADRYYFVKIRTEFKLRDGYLPFLQIKNDLLYNGRECLTTTDVVDINTGCSYRNQVELVLTMTDYELLKKHYHLYNTVIVGGCWFYAVSGIFDEYIDKYKHIKVTSTGAKRELAKLFLNNLYGKMATSKDSSFKVAHLIGDNIYFTTQTESEKKPGYIPVGSAITSYARYFTITHAQMNYHGPDKPGFIYADTDSIHCDLRPDQLVGIDVHPTDFCKWKLESYWDKAIFVRAKSYIEHVTHKDGELLDKPYNLIKCAGMPDACKTLFNYSLEGEEPDEKYRRKMSEEDINFLYEGSGNIIKRTYMDFKIGLSVPGKLRPIRIPGGVVLVRTPFVMRR